MYWWWHWFGSALALPPSSVSPSFLAMHAEVSPLSSPIQPLLHPACMSFLSVFFLHLLNETTLAKIIGDLHGVKSQLRRCLNSTGCHWSLSSLSNTLLLAFVTQSSPGFLSSSITNFFTHCYFKNIEWVYTLHQAQFQEMGYSSSKQHWQKLQFHRACIPV